MDLKKVERSQQRILKRIYDCEEPQSRKEASGLLREIRDYTAEDVFLGLGEVGKKIQDFSFAIDLSHPDLPNVLDGCLVGQVADSYSKDASDLLRLSTCSKNWNLSKNVLDSLRQAISSHKCHREVRTDIDSPVSNLLHVRFVPDKNTRKSIRCMKSAQNMPISLLCKKDREFWDNQYSDFDYLRRGRMCFWNDIKMATNRKKHFEEYGLSSMVKAIEDNISLMQKKSCENTYCKFNKVSLTNVAAILGKMMGYVYEEPSGSLKGRVYAPLELFQGYNFSDSSQMVLQAEWFGESTLEYLTKIYNAWEIPVSFQMEKLLDFLEEYPDMSGKPLFDHYRVFMPSVIYPTPSMSTSSDDFWQMNYGGLLSEQKRVDLDLVKKGLMLAVLLGERDGEHYFISYWM